MAVFEYIAKDTSGSKFSGVYTDIDSISALRQELSKMGYTLVKAHREKKSSGSARQKKIKQIEVVAFAYEFAGMYSAGLSITRCLETFESQSENPVLKDIIADVRQRIETGSTLTDAFDKHRAVFSDFFLGMVEAGEAGGKLGETLQMAAVYLEKQADLRAKVKSAFAYPIVVCVMCIVIVSALIIFVIPVFEKLYSQLNVTLPGPTQALIFISQMVRDNWMVTFPSLVIGFFVIRKVSRLPSVIPKLDSIKLSMPVFGKLNRMVVVSRFIRTFAMMAKAGVPVVEALDLGIRVADNSVMKKIGKDMQEEILTGNSVADPMSKNSIFPPMIVQMAASGEEAGILPEMLTKGVDFLDAQIERSIASLLVKIEPILSIVLGLVVGSILMGVYLPMFDYMGHVK